MKRRERQCSAPARCKGKPRAAGRHGMARCRSRISKDLQFRAHTGTGRFLQRRPESKTVNGNSCARTKTLACASGVGLVSRGGVQEGFGMPSRLDGSTPLGSLVVLVLASTAAFAQDGKVPITTKSEEARQAYLKGRDLFEKLRGTDAHEQFRKAAAADKDFALAQVGLANTAPSAKDFFEAVKQATSLVDKASEGERLIILRLDAGAGGDPAAQKSHLDQLTAAFPRDERAQNLLGGYYFGRQEYEQAIAAYEKAIAINPGFSQPYNQMGYAYRFIGKNDDAERAFKKYIE